MRRLVAKWSANKPTCRPKRRGLQFERLDARVLLFNDSADNQEFDEVVEMCDLSYCLFDYDEDTDTLQINGTDHWDIVDIDLVTEPGVGPGAPPIERVKVTHANGQTWDVTTESYSNLPPINIIFYGNDGDDDLSVLAWVSVTAYGGEGDDEFDGHQGWDTFYGGSGRDTLKGGGGEDELHGEDDADWLLGGPGDDDLFGGDEDDLMEGGNDDDELVGNQGRDTLKGDYGDDTLDGGAGSDDLQGGRGADSLVGGGQDDLIEGGLGDDELFGDNGDDRLYAGGGDDELDGGEGLDGLWGGGGVDFLFGGDGADRYLLYDEQDIGDAVVGKTSADVRIHFEDRSGADEYDIHWTGGEWTDEEIIELDEVFAAMVDVTLNNALLETADGNELTFLRVGDPTEDTDVAAWNDDEIGEIAIANVVFVDFHDEGGSHRLSFDDNIHYYVTHEIGHNWDNENDDWGEWKDLSGWKNPLFGPWKHAADAVFANNKADDDPEEDFAETFALFFAREMDELFRNEDPWSIANDLRHNERGDKFGFMENFIMWL